MEYRCVGCDATHKESWWGAPENGLLMPFMAGGYYGGFTDHFPPPDGMKYDYICHDCVVKMLEVLPGLKPLMMGGHSAPYEQPPCCNYAWTADFETRTHYRANNGQWAVDVTRTRAWRKQPK